MRESVGKLTVYLLCVLALFATDAILGDDIFSLVEVKSLAENVKRITGIDLIDSHRPYDREARHHVAQTANALLTTLHWTGHFEELARRVR